MVYQKLKREYFQGGGEAVDVLSAVGHILNMRVHLQYPGS